MTIELSDRQIEEGLAAMRMRLSVHRPEGPEDAPYCRGCMEVGEECKQARSARLALALHERLQAADARIERLTKAGIRLALSVIAESHNDGAAP